MFTFKNYKQYSDEIVHLWNEFHNQVIDENWVLVKNQQDDKTNYRILTEEEFNNK
jgi:hypothetical protein